MSSNIYGYMRVSTREQNEDRQRLALAGFGVKENNIYLDRQSGKDFSRTAYQKVLRKLSEGDVFVVKSIDRLGRNYHEILEQWRLITKEKKASIVVLDMPMLDTRRDKDLTGILIADIVLQLLSYVAEIERDLILQRQAEGIAAARERGVIFGRRPIEKPDEFQKVYREWQSAGISARAAARKLHISHQTFLKWTKKPGT